MLNIKSCLIVICQLIDERKKKKGDTEMEDLKNMIQKLMEEVKEIRKENRKYHEIVDKLAEENKEIKKENNEMQNMEDKLEQMERHQKKNNIVIYGMELPKEQN
jgi:DNA repair ATPase RecN